MGCETLGLQIVCGEVSRAGLQRGEGGGKRRWVPGGRGEEGRNEVHSNWLGWKWKGKEGGTRAQQNGYRGGGRARAHSIRRGSWVSDLPA